MEPAVGFEPTTDGLQNRCSTTELSWPEKLFCCQLLANSTRFYYGMNLSSASAYCRQTGWLTTKTRSEMLLQ
jgi:hypothetical protein